MTAPAWALAREAELAARRELERIPSWLWDGRSLPVPVEAIADSHYGLLVEEARDLHDRVDLHAGAHVSGLLLPAERLILVDADEAARAPGRRRFTITHEVGHWVLHRGDESAEPVWCRNETVREDAAEAPALAVDGATLLAYPPPELEANQFAAALLMPRSLLMGRARPRSVEEEYALASTFGVSREALRRRLWALDQGL